MGLEALLVTAVILTQVSLVTCECVWSNDVDYPRIDCSLRILDFRRNSSEVPGVKRVQELNVQCSHEFFFESQLRSDHFGNLPDLSELQIKFCKIRQLPPRSFVNLSNLKKLTINTFNEDWTSLVLSPDYETFIGLGALEYLDMADNNIERLPPRLLCPLESAKQLNFSRNSIQDLEDLGLSARTQTKCKIPLEKLILSQNRINLAPPKALAALETLKYLDLSSNELAVLVESTFSQLSHLETLNLNHNHLVSLPPKIFGSNLRLKNLDLSGNSIGTIDLSTFSNLSSLETLNLSSNSLDENWIKPGIFNGLRKLIILDLSFNHISKIDSDLLVDLHTLQVLSLSNNQIHTLASNAFANQINLHMLLLSNNELESLHHQTLNGLSVLNTIALDHNKLHSLHPESLKNCTGLQNVALNNNFLTQVPKALHRLPALETLNLSHNVIGVIKRESLQGLPNLKALLIANNEMSKIGEGAFKEAPDIQLLDLGGNRFQKFEQETFIILKNLQSLNLAENQLKEDINGLLQAQIHLKWLNISNNNLIWFDYAFVPPSVEWLDVHSNSIDALANYYNISYASKLTYLDASDNKISEIGPMNILANIEHLFLNKNRISKIHPETFLEKHQIKQIHLQKNELSFLQQAALYITPKDTSPVIYLADNPFKCDCHFQWFKDINSKIDDHPQVMDMDKISCSLVNHTNQVITEYIMQVSEDEFLCEYQEHCLPDCMCCDFLACDCQMKCPKGCTCFHNQNWSTNVIQCSKGNFDDIPQDIPMDTTTLYLDQTNMTQLKVGMLVGRSRLQKLSIAQSHVSNIANQSFAGLEELKTLDLRRNKLKHLRGYEFSGLSSIRELFLQQNQLVSIHPDTFKNLRLLSTLNLDGNLLIAFPIWELSSNSLLKHLTLANNWWQCDCDFVRKFRMFIDGNIDIIPDAKQITCTSSETSLSQLNQCSEIMNTHSYAYDNQLGIEMVPLGIGIAAVCIGLLVMVVILIKMRESCFIWLHAKHNIRLQDAFSTRGSQSEKEILFDALVFYSQKDETFVQTDFVSKLLPKYKVCLMQKDLAGIYTSEAFKSALSASARHVMVITQGFLATEMDYVKELVLSNCIVVMVEDKNDRIQQDLETTFKHVKFLQWNEPSFWRKLYFYLPDPSNVTTKEGGAELDVSGVWTFTSMDNGINASGISTTKLISSPSLSPRTQQRSFPAPPVRKQPHQCSTHYLAGAPAGVSGTTSPILNRSPVISKLRLIPETRSCGTNVVHQRSTSAIVETSQSLNASSHVRSSSLVEHQQQQLVPPPPPPKVANKNSIYNLNKSDSIYKKTDNSIYGENVHPGCSVLQRLPPPGKMDLIQRLPPIGQDQPKPESKPSLMVQSPIVNTISHHQRSVSLLEPNSPSRHFVKHERSSSSLAPGTGTPRQIQQRSTSGIVSVSRAASMLTSNSKYKSNPSLLGNSSRGLSSGGTRFSHNSTSNLANARLFNDSIPSYDPNLHNYHVRSKSTPYEGFVL